MVLRSIFLIKRDATTTCGIRKASNIGQKDQIADGGNSWAAPADLRIEVHGKVHAKACLLSRVQELHSLIGSASRSCSASLGFKQESFHFET